MFEEQEFKKIIRLMKTCMIISIIAAVFVICTHWRGFHLSITPPATSDTRVIVVERPAPVHHQKTRVIAAAPEDDETATDYQPPAQYRGLVPRVHDATARITLAPDAFTRTNIQADNSTVAAPDGYQPFYSVTVHPKKHRWPVRFFGAIGHGVRKVVTFGH